MVVLHGEIENLCGRTRKLLKIGRHSIRNARRNRIREKIMKNQPYNDGTDKLEALSEINEVKADIFKLS